MENIFTAAVNNITTNPNLKIPLAMIVPEWCRSVMIIFMVIVLVAGLPGNIFVILVQINTKNKSTTDWFVTFLAISDVLSLVVNIPCYIIMMTGEWQSVGSHIGCKLHHFVILLSFGAQTIIVAFNAVDRLWKSSSIYQLFTPKRVIYSGLFAFALSTGLGTIAAFSVGNNVLGQCILDPSKKYLQLILYILLLAVAALSSFVIVVSYTRILVTLRARNRVGALSNTSGNIFQNTTHVGAARYTKALQTTKLMFIVTVVFIITTIIPSIAVIILSGTEYRNSYIGSILVFLLTKMYFINNCANPYTYFCLNTTFRRKIIDKLKNGIF